MTTTETKKTPADFQAEAERHNGAINALLNKRAALAMEAQSLMQERDALIASAKDYGLTGSYARTLLRKP